MQTIADRVDAIRRRLAAATPGPWHTDGSDVWVESNSKFGKHKQRTSQHRMSLLSDDREPFDERDDWEPIVAFHPDAVFIANAPADIDWLLTEVTAAAAREEMLLADIETTRANLSIAWGVAGNAEYDRAEAVRDLAEVKRELAETQECLRALQAANAARRERDTDAINADYADRLQEATRNV